MLVNNELGELAGALAAAERVLKPEGRLVVVSFHSLEDRLVKTVLQARAGAVGGGSRHLPAPVPDRAASLRLLQRGAVEPSAAETAANPRARSAKLRAAARTAAPAWGAVEPPDLAGLAMTEWERIA
jgi:16S rRNA (cytosine1402-N4)-methyltransferase